MALTNNNSNANNDLLIEIDTYKREIGKRLSKLRKEKGVSQESLAYEAGIQRKHLSQIENGTVSMTIKTLYLLSKALNIEPGYLIDIND